MSKPPVSRRGLLAAGIGGVGATAALTALRPSEAFAAGDPTPAPSPTVVPPPSTDVAYVSPSGKTDGAEDLAAINQAMQSNHVVILMPGTYYIDGPIQFAQSGQLLTGYMGATQSGAGSPGVNTTIKAGTSTFTTGLTVGAAGLVMNNNFPRCEIRDLWLDGSTLPAGTDCITVYGQANGFGVRRVGCNNAPGYGLNAKNVSGTGNDPIGFLAVDMVIQGCSVGGVFVEATDISMLNVHAQSNAPSAGSQAGGDGITIKTGNARLVACRSDLNGGYGFVVGCFNGSQNIGVGVTMVGCGTERNGLSAVNATGGGNSTYGPVQMTGCWFQGDGANTALAGPAAIPCVLAQGRVTVSLTDVVIAAGNNGSSVYPAYCVQTLKNSSGAVPDLVTVMGGMWQAGTAFINDAGPATRGQLIGTVGFIGDGGSGTSGTTIFVKVPNTFHNAPA